LSDLSSLELKRELLNDKIILTDLLEKKTWLLGSSAQGVRGFNQAYERELFWELLI